MNKQVLYTSKKLTVLLTLEEDGFYSHLYDRPALLVETLLKELPSFMSGCMGSGWIYWYATTGHETLWPKDRTRCSYGIHGEFFKAPELGRNYRPNW